LPLEELAFNALDSSFDLSEFDCGDPDISDWLRNDSLVYQNQRMANTYLFCNNAQIVAFFCISNDSLNDLGEMKGFTNTIWNRFHRKSSIPNTKRIRNYPAIKIGRIGVSINHQKTGLAYELMDFIKGFSIMEHKPACRLMLLDAYNKGRQINFYQKNGFRFVLDADQNAEKRLMYFDLDRMETLSN
jgi:hypothetical protein